MSSLANTYRPQKLTELLGQDPLVQGLSYAINHNKIPQALLLTGMHGIGKTTTGRCIGKSLLCESGPRVEPCGTCESCKMVNENRHPDLIEIDAASHASVDDARNHVASLAVRPMISEYRVLIIDEAHGLSDRAWDAWLKTVEEPPPKTIIIFASTDIKQIPATIRSRSAVYSLQPLSLSTIQARLIEVSQHESLNTTQDAALLIARMSEGSMRDALSMLQQAANTAQDHPITDSTIRTMLSLPAHDSVVHLVKDLVEHNTKDAFGRLKHLLDAGIPSINIIRDALDSIYQSQLLKINPESLTPMALSEDTKTCLRAIMERPKEAKSVWDALHHAIDLIKYSPTPTETLTLTLLNTCP